MSDPELNSSPRPDAFSLPRSEVRRRSLAGILFLTSSNFASLLVGFVASLALARMLTPSDFGVVAIGSTALLLVTTLADGGLGAGMVRRPEPPTRSDLKTMNGIQFVLALAICLPIVAIAAGFGRTGAITAVMIASLPITLLQTPGRIVLLREMRYDRTLAIDFGTQTTFYVFSVVAVALGAGVWGLAAAAIVRAITGTALTGALSIGLLLPSLRGWRRFGDLVKFGLKFQAAAYTFQAREQGLNIAVGAIAGVATLGIWTFTNRIFQLPSLAFNSLYIVGFPAMSNLLARGEDAAPVIIRTVRRAAIAATFVFPAFAASSPELIPSVFGEQWRDAALIIPFLCLSTLMLGSIAVASTSYLAAAARPGVNAWASASLGVVWIGVTVILLPVMGVVAIGIGNLAGAFVEVAILNRATRRTAGVSPVRPMLRPLVVAIVAGGAGWLFCTNGSGGAVIALAAAGLTSVLATVGLWIACRADLKDAFGLVGGAISSVFQSIPMRGGGSDAPPTAAHGIESS